MTLKFRMGTGRKLSDRRSSKKRKLWVSCACGGGASWCWAEPPRGQGRESRRCRRGRLSSGAPRRVSSCCWAHSSPTRCWQQRPPSPAVPGHWPPLPPPPPPAPRSRSTPEADTHTHIYLTNNEPTHHCDSHTTAPNSWVQPLLFPKSIYIYSHIMAIYI